MRLLNGKGITMNRREKQLVIDSIQKDLKQAQASFIVSTKGMTVSAVQNLRRSLYEKQGTIKVVKNTLLIRATSDVPGLSDLSPYFKDQIALVLAPKEAPAIAKILYNATKELETLKLKAGVLDSRLISIEQIVSLASLPSREVMLARVCGTLQSPIAAYVRILNQLIVRLLWVLKEIEKKKTVNV